MPDELTGSSSRVEVKCLPTAFRLDSPNARQAICFMAGFQRTRPSSWSEEALLPRSAQDRQIQVHARVRVPAATKPCLTSRVAAMNGGSEVASSSAVGGWRGVKR